MKTIFYDVCGINQIMLTVPEVAIFGVLLILAEQGRTRRCSTLGYRDDREYNIPKRAKVYEVKYRSRIHQHISLVPISGHLGTNGSCQINSSSSESVSFGEAAFRHSAVMSLNTTWVNIRCKPGKDFHNFTMKASGVKSLTKRVLNISQSSDATELTSPNSSLEDPSYPSYPSYSSMEWILASPTRCRISFNFTEFEINECDLVTIRPDPTSSASGRWIGRKEAFVFNTWSRKSIVHFQTYGKKRWYSANKKRRVFRALVTASDCLPEVSSCNVDNETITLTIGEVDIRRMNPTFGDLLMYMSNERETRMEQLNSSCIAKINSNIFHFSDGQCDVWNVNKKASILEVYFAVRKFSTTTFTKDKPVLIKCEVSKDYSKQYRWIAKSHSEKSLVQTLENERDNFAKSDFPPFDKCGKMQTLLEDIQPRCIVRTEGSNEFVRPMLYAFERYSERGGVKCKMFHNLTEYCDTVKTQCATDLRHELLGDCRLSLISGNVATDKFHYIDCNAKQQPRVTSQSCQEKQFWDFCANVTGRFFCGCGKNRFFSAEKMACASPVGLNAMMYLTVGLTIICVIVLLAFLLMLILKTWGRYSSQLLLYIGTRYVFKEREDSQRIHSCECEHQGTFPE